MAIVKNFITDRQLCHLGAKSVGFISEGDQGLKLVEFDFDGIDLNAPGFYFFTARYEAIGFTYVGKTRTGGALRRFVSSIRNGSSGPTAKMRELIRDDLYNNRIYHVDISDMKYLLNPDFGRFRQAFNTTPRSEAQSLEEIKQKLHDLYAFTAQDSRQ
ncbi:Ndd-like nucleoid disruption protein [Serratia phage 92A1]|nr:Ndd-like nucleoid disruption protein [Serratia phage 92A1]